MLEAKAKALLLAWRENLLSSDDILEWTYEHLLECDDAARLPLWLLTLAQCGPEKCLQMTFNEFSLLPLEHDFAAAFALRAMQVNLTDAGSIEMFAKWLSENCMGEDLDRPWVQFGYQVDHLLNDCGRLDRAVGYVREELPSLLPEVQRTADALLNESA